MIYLARHGESDFNFLKIRQGRSNLPKLTERGIEQAKNLSYNIKDIKFDVIFCSPLRRTRETLAQIIPYHKETPVIYDDRIVEISFGSFENIKKSEIKPEDWEKYLADPNKYGGETYKQVFERTKKFYNFLIEEYNNKNVLVVTHGGVISMFYYAVNHNEFIRENFTETKVDNASLHQFDNE